MSASRASATRFTSVAMRSRIGRLHLLGIVQGPRSSGQQTTAPTPRAPQAGATHLVEPDHNSIGFSPQQARSKKSTSGQACLLGLSLKAPSPRRFERPLRSSATSARLSMAKLLRIGLGKPLLYLGDRHTMSVSFELPRLCARARRTMIRPRGPRWMRNGSVRLFSTSPFFHSLANLLAEVVQLGATHVTTAGMLNLVNLGRGIGAAPDAHGALDSER